MIGLLFSRLWGYLAAAGAVLAAIATVWFSGRRAGRTAAQIEAVRQGEQARARGEEAAREAQKENIVARLRRGGM
jgi:hypothetical protein